MHLQGQGGHTGPLHYPGLGKPMTAPWAVPAVGLGSPCALSLICPRALEQTPLILTDMALSPADGGDLEVASTADGNTHIWLLTFWHLVERS